MKPVCLFAFILLTSCQVMRGSQSNAQTEENTVHFLTFDIHKSPGTADPVVKLVSRATGNGIIKKHWNDDNLTADFLTLYLYNSYNLIDSIRLAHPLYQHIEYLDGGNQFATKDTVLNTATFFVRFQTAIPVTSISITETLGQSGFRQISTIKL